MGLATTDPHRQKEHTEIYKIPTSGVNQASYSHLKTSKLQRNVGSSGHFVMLTFSNGCILLTIGSIYTKLGDFVKLGLHFMTLWINTCSC